MRTSAVRRTERHHRQFDDVGLHDTGPHDTGPHDTEGRARRAGTTHLVRCPHEAPARRLPVRPDAGIVDYRRAPVRVSRAPHRPAEVTHTRPGTVLATALLTALVTAGLLGIAHLRTSQVAAGAARTDVTVVQAGESLGDVAARVAPGLSRSEAIERILDLNAMPDGRLRTGQTLLVPASAPR